jgi:hypothetical protein
MTAATLAKMYESQLDRLAHDLGLAYDAGDSRRVARLMSDIRVIVHALESWQAVAEQQSRKARS